MTAPIQLLIGSRNLTPYYSDLSWSNVDPGGYEQLTCSVSDDASLAVGQEVMVRYGLETAWHGRVNEIGDRGADGRSATQITALGYGSKLTDKRIQMIYADRDLSHWTGAGRQRAINLVAGNYMQPEGPQPMTDAASGLPALLIRHADEWTLPIRPIAELWLDAGEGNLIGSVYYDFVNVGNATTGDTNWDLLVRTTNTDAENGGSVVASTGDIWTSVNVTGTLTDGTGSRYAFVSFFYNVAGGGAGAQYSIHLRNPAVYGNHGLTKRGSAPEGFYPGDIVGHALTHSGAGFELVADDSSGLTVKHSVYRDPTPHQTVISDMAQLMGWHYGTWEPRTILDSTPRQFFTAPPASPTCVAARREIQDLDSPKVRVDRLYDTAKVKWQDPAGTAGVVTVTISNPLAAMAGVTGRTLDLDMGQGDSTSATAFGTFALNLALASARGGGSGTVPDTVTLPAGGRKPACLLKSGRDRIRILDLPGSGSVTETDANRQDSFLVRRVETSVKKGKPSTRVEFDGGADLLEVLTARLALSAFG
jgi:hypothetical protein